MKAVNSVFKINFISKMTRSKAIYSLFDNNFFNRNTK